MGNSLLELIGHDSTDIPFDCFREWEREIAEPRLERLGYTTLAWYSDFDSSFNVDTRSVLVRDSDGLYWYEY